MRKAKFVELSSWDKYQILYKKEDENIKGTLKFHERVANRFLYAFLDQLSPQLKVDPKPKRFKKILFWRKGISSKAPDGPMGPLDRLKKRVMSSGSSNEAENLPQVVMLLFFKGQQGLMKMRAYKNVPKNSLVNLIPGGKVKLKQLDVFMQSCAICWVFVLLILQKIFHRGFFGLFNISWEWAIFSALAITVVSGYLTLLARRNIYQQQLAECNHENAIASDDALLTYLINQAEEEVMKEAMLTVMGILLRTENQRRLTVIGIERNTTEYLQNQLCLDEQFKTSVEALDLLEQIGLITRNRYLFDFTQNSNNFEICPFGSSLFPVEIDEIILH